MTTPADNTLREPWKAIAEILQFEMGIQDGHIVGPNQEWDIPPDDELYVHLSYLGPGKIIGSNNTVTSDGDGPGDGMTETQQVTMQHQVQIDFMSFDGSAYSRIAEFPMALQSVKAQQVMEQYQVGVARMPAPFVDASSDEPAKRLNRFVTTIAVDALYSRTKAAPYYRTFTTPEVTPNA